MMKKQHVKLKDIETGKDCNDFGEEIQTGGREETNVVIRLFVKLFNNTR